MISENAKSRWITDFENGVSLSFAPDSVKDNKELVLIAVGLSGMNLQYASERLRNDIDVVETAIKQNSAALQFASGDLHYQFIQGGLARFQELKKQVVDDIGNGESERKFMELYNTLVRLMCEQRRISESILDIQSEMLKLYPNESINLFTTLEDLDEVRKHEK